DHIEVVKGPASVLYGQANPGGVINLTSKRPRDDFGGKIKIEGGSYDRKYAAFDLGGPLDAGKTLLYRFGGVAYDTDTQVDHPPYQRAALFSAVTFKPDDATRLTFIGGYQHDPAAGFYNYLPVQGVLLPNSNGKVSASFFGGEPGDEAFNRSQFWAGYEF